MHRQAEHTFYFFTTVAALLLSGLCIALPVYQWASLGSSWPFSVGAGLAAFAIALCKLTFAPLAFYNANNKKPLAAFALGSVAALATWFSITATAATLATLETSSRQQLNASNAHYQITRTALEQLNTDINSLNRLIATDLKNNYRARALEHRQNLAALYQRQDTLTQALNQAASAAQGAPQATFAKNLNLPLGATTLRLSSATLTAAALHLMAIVALLAVGPWRQTPAVKTQHNTREPTANANTPAPKKTPEQPALTAEQQALAARLCAGEFGHRFSLRNIARTTRGGYQRVRPVFSWLEHHNKIQRLGNNQGYALTTHVKEKP